MRPFKKTNFCSVKNGTKFWRVDGFVEAEKLIIEVQGCYYHGCERHYRHRDTPTPLGKTPAQLHAATMERIAQLKSRNYKVHSIWECEIADQLKRDPSMKRFFDECVDSSPLEYRAGFFG